MAEKDLGNRLRRAVKENNLFHVRRLIERVDMRNPDPGPLRYTSLAWSAVCGNEQIFEYLLTERGHDDEELSKDGENNTILILLAGLGGTGPASMSQRSPAADVDLRDSAVRMARLYYDRYPFMLDWSNSQGKTALHVAALKGNEEMVKLLCDLGAYLDMPDGVGNTPLHYASAWNHEHIIQLLIERECQYIAKNTEGFTALDYAYSTAVADFLQETVRKQFENKKSARRNVFAQAAARGNEWRKSTLPDNIFIASMTRDFQPDTANRLRSGSGGSRTTMTSDDDNLSIPGPSSFSSSISSQQSLITPTSRSGQHVPSKSPSLNALSSAYNAAMSIRSGQKASAQPTAPHRLPAWSPVASRMREKDADAIEQYKRSRSGSGGSIVPSLLSYESGTTVTYEDRYLRPSISSASLGNADGAQTSTSSTQPVATQAPAAALSPEKPAARKLLSRRNRPGTAPDSDPPPFPVAVPINATSTSRKIPFSILPGRHTSSNERGGHGSDSSARLDS